MSPVLKFTSFEVGKLEKSRSSVSTSPAIAMVRVLDSSGVFGASTAVHPTVNRSADAVARTTVFLAAAVLDFGMSYLIFEILTRRLLQCQRLNPNTPAPPQPAQASVTPTYALRIVE